MVAGLGEPVSAGRRAFALQAPPLAWPRPRSRPQEAVLLQLLAPPPRSLAPQGFGVGTLELGLLWQYLSELQMQKPSVPAGLQPSSSPRDKRRLVGPYFCTRLSFATLFLKAKE